MQFHRTATLLFILPESKTSSSCELQVKSPLCWGLGTPAPPITCTPAALPVLFSLFLDPESRCGCRITALLRFEKIFKAFESPPSSQVRWHLRAPTILFLPPAPLFLGHRRWKDQLLHRAGSALLRDEDPQDWVCEL